MAIKDASIPPSPAQQASETTSDHQLLELPMDPETRKALLDRPATMKPERLMNVYEVADLLQLSPSHVRSLVKNGKLPGTNYGNGARRFLRFRASDLLNFDPSSAPSFREAVPGSTTYGEAPYPFAARKRGPRIPRGVGKQ